MTSYFPGVLALLWGLARLGLVAVGWRRGIASRPGHRLAYGVLGGLIWCGLGFTMIAIAVGVPRPYALALAVATLISGVVILAIGAWRVPAALRLIGDPKAWRGERQPDWVSRDTKRRER